MASRLFKGTPDPAKGIDHPECRLPRHFRRLDFGPNITAAHHFGLLEHVLSSDPEGTAVEFGVGTGQSTRLIAERMPVVGFDSFQGLPEFWRKGFRKGKFAVPEPPEVPNAQIVIGLFADTLPVFDFSAIGSIGLVHMDADLYSSTKIALEHVGPFLRPGCYLVFDEFHSYLGAEQHEQRAWAEFVYRTGITYEPVGHSFEQWACRLT